MVGGDLRQMQMSHPDHGQSCMVPTHLTGPPKTRQLSVCMHMDFGLRFNLREFSIPERRRAAAGILPILQSC
jgi:hypothetical protein